MIDFIGLGLDKPTTWALVAQWIEHLASDQGVEGSNPPECTEKYGWVAQLVRA